MIQRAALRDESSLASLYDAASPVVYGLSLRILGNALAAEDTVVEVYSGIWDGRFRFDPSNGSPLLWIIAITRGCALERLRAAGNVIPINGLVEPPRSESAPLLHETWLSQESARARKALEVLPPEVRKALELAYFEGLTAEEIAPRLLASAETVRTRIRQGMAQLREGFGLDLRMRNPRGRD
ncbi:MAG: sigma-70 family RNA polymerase sigma factor [Acidobacteriota bacterium]|nr:sigma-70 family RNA polymerase sigma factor [Acidobacteriota bacterium]